jgi:histone H3/H4
MSAPITSKKMSIKVPKQTRKERRATKEVAALQERTTLILPATTFKRIVQQVSHENSTERLRFNTDAIHAIQTAAEHELTTVFTGAAFCASIGKRETVTVEDMRNFQALRDLK